ncbi:hypothetical protein MSKU15_0693 [Komagataeibacter diospyri]|uniref:Secreted protein n=1 Tax=Komagataeibacter diospyri TaxID=1932662 RepID=A0A4P5NVW5_9PROT|nr:hypothetical protein MSKU9_3225 [Komagataeibacter diospyri]GCE89092.1 hypothetical protein MSKU15_0693 [Komagataeibacter diospyri]
MSCSTNMKWLYLAVMICSFPLTAHAQFATPRSSPGKPVTTTPPVHDQNGSGTGTSERQHMKTHKKHEQYPSGQSSTGPEPVTGDQNRTEQAAPMQ